ncbi:uncharacterized protein LOC131806834 [Musca domestica]|uniref:Uncharacterized protein LOC131806834 n=1 Tax=Musca domestica TaxID=7370 RepID=A0ABM3VP81_MUSDO|nr:uncharacterized protein LOC131806834 [Musca domestica]
MTREREVNTDGNKCGPPGCPKRCIHCRKKGMLYLSDGVNLSEDEKQEMETLLVEFAKVFADSGEPTPYAVHKIDTENDIIEECDSAWASPVVMVPKTDGLVRVCVNYRNLNAITIPDRYLLPRMDDLVQRRENQMKDDYL